MSEAETMEGTHSFPPDTEATPLPAVLQPEALLPRRRHVMLDSETMGTRPGCAVVAIGACVFDRAGVHEWFEAVAPMDGSMLGHFDPETVGRFWLRQPLEVQRYITTPTVRSQATMLLDFEDWFRRVGGAYVWCRGPDFDIPIVEEAYRLHDLLPPWREHAKGRDVRTAIEDAGMEMPPRPSHLFAHGALNDALFQAECVIEARRRMRTPGWEAPTEER